MQKMNLENRKTLYSFPFFLEMFHGMVTVKASIEEASPQEVLEEIVESAIERVKKKKKKKKSKKDGR